MSGQGEGFLSRWSRRKSGLPGPAPGSVDPQVRETRPAGPASSNEIVPASTAGTPSDGSGLATGPAPVDPVPLPTLEDVAALTRSSDYSRFVQPGVEPGVRNAAMKKLFADPHFNVMDGLDTYIDDYGQPDPIPPAMLRMMNQATSLGLFDDDPADPDPAEAAAPVAPALRLESPSPALACPDGDTPASVAQSHPNPSTVPAPAQLPLDDDADLRLQPDDAPGRRGAEPGTRA